VEHGQRRLSASFDFEEPQYGPNRPYTGVDLMRDQLMQAAQRKAAAAAGTGFPYAADARPAGF
jgi:hypothetical protein